MLLLRYSRAQRDQLIPFKISLKILVLFMFCQKFLLCFGFQGFDNKRNHIFYGRLFDLISIYSH